MSLLRSSLFRSLVAGFLVGTAGLWMAQPHDARAAFIDQAGSLARAVL